MTNYSSCLENGAVSGDSSEVHDLTPDRTLPRCPSLSVQELKTLLAPRFAQGLGRIKMNPFQLTENQKSHLQILQISGTLQFCLLCKNCCFK